MNNTFLLFYIYILITLFFLVPLFCLINIELYKIFNVLYFNFFNTNISNTSLLQFYSLINFYIKRNKWFFCICMLEFLYKKEIANNYISILMYLAYCYERLNYLYIAEYYYLKILSYSPSNIDTLSKLSAIYKVLNQTEKLSKISSKINLLKNQ